MSGFVLVCQDMSHSWCFAPHVRVWAGMILFYIIRSEKSENSLGSHKTDKRRVQRIGAYREQIMNQWVFMVFAFIAVILAMAGILLNTDKGSELDKNDVGFEGDN